MYLANRQVDHNKIGSVGAWYLAKGKWPKLGQLDLCKCAFQQQMGHHLGIEDVSKSLKDHGPY